MEKDFFSTGAIIKVTVMTNDSRRPFCSLHRPSAPWRPYTVFGAVIKQCESALDFIEYSSWRTGKLSGNGS